MMLYRDLGHPARFDVTLTLRRLRLPMRTALIFALVLFALPLFSAEHELAAVRTNTPPVIDGVLEDCWNSAPECTSFLSMTTSRPAVERSSVRALYDAGGLYLAVECFTVDAGSIQATAFDTDPAVRFPPRFDNPVWRDDSIEIMLDPGVTGTDFYHFAVNAKGGMFNCRKIRRGTMVEKWNGDWQAAASIGSDRWTCEVYIPYHTLALDGGIDKGWGINVCRNSIAGREQSCISRDGTFNRPHVFRRLTGMDADLRPFMWKVSAESRPTVRGGKQSTITSAAIQNDTTARRAVSVQVFDSSGARKPVPLTLDPGNSSEMLLAEKPLSPNGGEMLFDILLTDAGSGQVLSYRHLRITPESRLFSARVTEPSYRDTIYATQKIENIRVRVQASVPEQEARGWKANGELMSGGKRIARSPTLPLKDGGAEISIRPGNLSVGEYEIRINLLDAGNRALASDNIALRKLAPFKGEARFDDNKVLLVDGEPFLPLGYMGVIPDDMETIAKGGGNTIHNYNAYRWSLEFSKSFMDEAQRVGLKVVLPPWGSEEDYWRLSPTLSKEEAEGITRQVNLYKDHPNFLAWYMADEPEGVGTPVSKLKEAYDLVRRLDPYHPCIMLNDSLHGIESYAGTADIMMPDPYCRPTIRGFSSPMTMVSDFMDQIQKSSPESASWATLQAFDYGDFRENLTTDRCPTLDEFRSMTWLTINHGCRGFIHYAWPYIQTNADLYMGLPYILKELDALSGVVLSPNRKQLSVEPQGSGIDAAMVEHDGKTWLIVVNTVQEPREYTLTLPGVGDAELRIVGEEGTAPISQGRLQDRLDASETRIYVTGDPGFSLSKASVLESIAQAETARRKPGNMAFWADNGTVAKASSWILANQYGAPRGAINGFISENGTQGWKDRTPEFPDWIELTWPQSREIGKVILYSHNLKDYELQYRQAGDWVTLERGGGDASLNRKTEHIFTPVETDALRVLVHSAFGDNSIISEIECYAR